MPLPFWLLSKAPDWVFRRALRLDRWANRHLLNGWKGETISSRGGKAILRYRAGCPEPGDWKWRALCSFLDLFQKDHCVKCVDRQRGRQDKLPADPR